MWDLVQRRQIGQNRREIRNASRDARDASESVARLQASVDRLALVCQAMWSLVKDNTPLSEEDLTAKVKEMDRMDGQSDGMLSRQVGIACTVCKRPNNRRQRQCMYCGAELFGDSAFDTL